MKGNLGAVRGHCGQRSLLWMLWPTVLASRTTIQRPPFWLYKLLAEATYFRLALLARTRARAGRRHLCRGNFFDPFGFLNLSETIMGPPRGLRAAIHRKGGLSMDSDDVPHPKKLFRQSGASF